MSEEFKMRVLHIIGIIVVCIGAQSAYAPKGEEHLQTVLFGERPIDQIDDQEFDSCFERFSADELQPVPKDAQMPLKVFLGGLRSFLYRGLREQRLQDYIRIAEQTKSACCATKSQERDLSPSDMLVEGMKAQLLLYQGVLGSKA